MRAFMPVQRIVLYAEANTRPLTNSKVGIGLHNEAHGHNFEEGFHREETLRGR